MVLPPLFHFGFLFLYYWQKGLGGKVGREQFCAELLKQWHCWPVDTWRVRFQRTFLRVKRQDNPLSFSHLFCVRVCLDCQIRDLSQEPNSHISSEGKDSLVFCWAGAQPQGTGSKPTNPSEQYPIDCGAVWRHFCSLGRDDPSCTPGN